MILNIGLDIDGCLNYFGKYLKEIIDREYNSNIPMNDWNMLENAGIDDPNDQLKFWKKYNKELLDKTPIENGALEGVKTLIENGFHIDVITARGYHVARLTENWLMKYQIPYHNIFFQCDDKVEVCKWRDIDLMIEDSGKNALEIAKQGIRVLLYDRPYNQNVEHKNIIRCKNWEEIIKEIEKITINEVSGWIY
ncbi:MAG: 5' nucleotidase, NT5C type [archaeon]